MWRVIGKKYCNKQWRPSIIIHPMQQSCVTIGISTKRNNNDYYFWNSNEQRWVSSNSTSGKKSKKQAMKRQMNQNKNITSDQVKKQEVKPFHVKENASTPTSTLTSLTKNNNLSEIKAGKTTPSTPTLLSTSRVSQISNSLSDVIVPPPSSDFGIIDQKQSDKAIEIDYKDMFQKDIHLPYAPTSWDGYEPATPLSNELMQLIGVTGRPLTIAEYMEHCLTHPIHGYYTNPPKTALQKSLQQDYKDNNDDDDDDDDDYEWDTPQANNNNNDSTLIGPQGDFVTAPEVSNIFGECLCVWFVTQWQNLLQRPQKIQWVEFGPGRGTLLVDMIRIATSSKLSHFGKTIHTIHLIETSPSLRQEQANKLQNELGSIVQWEFIDKHNHDDKKKSDTKNNDNEKTTTTNNNNDNIQDKKQTQQQQYHIRVVWHSHFASVQHYIDQNKDYEDMPMFCVLQEFLDALPVHVFEQTVEGWRERLIDVVDQNNIETSKLANDNDDIILPNNNKNNDDKNKNKPRPRFRQVLAPGPTPAVDLFFGSTKQNDNEKTTTTSSLSNNSNKDNDTGDDAPIGTVVEISPQSIFLVQDIAATLQKVGGGVALIIDYGQEGTGDTIRAFSNHEQVPITSYPGQVDVTANVDYHVLKEAINNNNNNKTSISAFGPVSQGDFLMSMGASDMVIQFLEKDETTEEQAIAATNALKYLVLPEHMGSKFQLLALAQKKDGIFAPAGF